MRPRGIFLFLFTLGCAARSGTAHDYGVLAAYRIFVSDGDYRQQAIFGLQESVKITTDGAITEPDIPTANTGTQIQPVRRLCRSIESPGNKIGKITPPNSIMTEYPLPTPIFKHHCGTGWQRLFTEKRAPSARSRRHCNRVPIWQSGRGQITAGPDGNLWFMG